MIEIYVVNPSTGTSLLISLLKDSDSVFKVLFAKLLNYKCMIKMLTLGQRIYKITTKLKRKKGNDENKMGKEKHENFYF